MKEIRIHVAEGFHDEDLVEPVLIRIEARRPRADYGSEDFEKRAAELFQADGKALSEAIWGACPGGTIDALIAALLSRRASMFRVRFSQESR